MSQIMNIADPRSIDSNFRIDAPMALPSDEVQLWRAELEALRDEEPRWQNVLSSEESARAARFHFARDRQHFVAARALLRIILGGYLGSDPKSLGFSYSKKEKPSLAPTHAGGRITFNISHSGGVALFAFTREREIGVDVEQVRRDFDLEGIARRFFSLHEQKELADLPTAEKIDAFFRCWTRKEAYIKATGDGLSLPLSQFDVSLAAGEKNALLATRPDEKEAECWRLEEVPAGAGYSGALCVRGKEWRLHGWS
jgi:4'-phosphopantetheinyl transferase